ncbi:MAG: NAD-dependent epimerase/dehydratase family protein, partial [Candidatus Thorarchaeota archaeon]
MKVLITGITGFVGSKLSTRLIDAGHEVTALVRETSNISGINEVVVVKEVDLFNPESLEEAVTSSEATVVIHLAS